MKYIYRVAVAILTLAIGVTISPVRFQRESVACGPHSSNTSYRSSYFIRASKSYTHFDSEALASDAFKKELSEAITIYDISPQVNKEESVLIEQHAVALFYDEGNDDFYVVSFWREGQELHSIGSRSYSHVKELEKQYFAVQ
jgi:hypothetical protein